MFYKAVIECGHIGAGNSIERVWFLKGNDPIAVLQRARMLPRVKRKDTLMSIKLLQRISKSEYIRGMKDRLSASLQ